MDLVPATDSGHGAYTGEASRRSSPVGWRRARSWTQTLSVILFIGLVFSVKTPWGRVLPHDLFVRFDPLVALLNSVAARCVAEHALLALGFLLLTALMGRVFCGWICPLGAAIDAVGALTGRKRRQVSLLRLGSIRFWLLGGLVGAAVFRLNFAQWLDPLVMSARALHVPTGAKVGLTVALAAWGLLATAMGLSLLARRFWCRALCPLGALLSVVGARARFRRRMAEGCRTCGACTTECPLGNPAGDAAGDCLLCRRCESVCSQQAIHFAWRSCGAQEGTPASAKLGFDRSKRRMFGVLGGLVIGGVAGFSLRGRPSRPVLRPPGAKREREFSARCVGCGACWTVCPTGGLRPVLAWTRLETAFSPELVPRIGPCLPECVACGTVCPTGAIGRLTPQKKLLARIGVAVIDRERCLPWAGVQRCVICVDACPPPCRAIELRKIESGKFLPVVDASRCTGCGICEHRCPAPGDAAIRVKASACF